MTDSCDLCFFSSPRVTHCYACGLATDNVSKGAFARLMIRVIILNICNRQEKEIQLHFNAAIVMHFWPPSYERLGS